MIKEPAAAPAPAAATSAELGTVSGTAAAGSIVVLEPKTAREFPPGEPPFMDQISATFTPDLLIVRTGQPVEFRNSDDTLHNVHVSNVDTKEPSFNVAIPTGEKYVYKFGKDGFYHVGCDIHPAMSAEVFSASTPFVARADGSGGFYFEGVPPGAYIARAFLAGEKTERALDVRGGPNTIAVQ